MKRVSILVIAVLALAASAFTTEARRDTSAPKEDLVMTLTPGNSIPFAFATVDQIKIITTAEYANCVCQGYCRWATEPPHYNQWVRECAAGGSPFYVYGIGTQFFCYYCPPPPC